MLKFIFGRTGTGKTYTLLEKIKESINNGRSCVLLVPEQASFEAERRVVKALGDRASLYVSIVSFTQLCDVVSRKTGGMAGKTLSGADKVIFMNRALLCVQPELKLWQRYCNSVSFAKTMLDTVGEFKINAFTVDMIKNAAEDNLSPSLKQKLLEIAKIYETYDGLVGEKFIDPADNLTKLYRNLENYNYFKGKDVFIDSFKGFTGQQFKIIDRIMSQADNVTVSMTNDPYNNLEYGIFANIRQTAERIRKSALRYGQVEDEAIVLKENRYNSESLSATERLLSGDTPEVVDDGAVTICAAETRRDEAEFAARTIRKLVRTKGYRYTDFVIIARDAEMYEEEVYAACRANGISCFVDKRIPLSSFPVAAAVSAAIEAVISLSTDSILRFHKTGLGALDLDEIAILENYTFLWGIEGRKWNENWDMDPRGFVTDEVKDEELKELEKINNLRKKAIAPINNFSATFSGTALNMAKAVYMLLDGLDAGEKLAQMSVNYKEDGNEFSSDVLKQSYDIYMGLLDSIVNCFGEKSISVREFYEALTLAVSFETVGVIPRMLDEVTFGAADRIRPSTPKVAIILGANQGVFPRIAQSTGILSQNERQSLLEHGIELPDSDGIASIIDENYLVYCNLSCPTDELYICYSLHSVSGEKAEASTFVEEIKSLTNANFCSEPQENISEDNIPETLEAAYSEYCRRYLQGNTGAKEIKAALGGTAVSKKTEYLDFVLSGKEKSLQPDTAKELFGKDLIMSATRLDTYRKCPFSYFCRYGIKANKLRPADFDVLQRGTIVHFVLEKFVTDFKKEICRLNEEEINDLVDKYIDEYLDSVSGYRTIESEKTRFLVSRISRSLKAVVAQLAREFAQTDFEPVACELKIGDEDGLPPVEIKFDGGRVSIIGSIDRVDQYNGYIRVVDYKTGSRKFKLPDVLFGLNLQMLVYLYAAVRGKGIDDSKAAGILYMPSKRDLNDTGMAMNGLLQNDKDLISAMDKELMGEFVPKMSFTKAGTLDKRCSSFIAPDDFSRIFDYIEKLISKTGVEITSGKIAISPIDGRDLPACKYCDYANCCGIENSPCDRVPDLKNDEVIEKMKEDKGHGI